jgi:hypothetical protein
MSFETMVAQYVQLRDVIKAHNDAHKAKMKPFNEALDQLGTMMLQNLTSTGQQRAGTKAGTVYVTDDISATIADKEAFRRHVIGSQNWDLIDWKANKSAIRSIVMDEGLEPPPGINFSRQLTVGVRRGNGE